LFVVYTFGNFYFFVSQCSGGIGNSDGFGDFAKSSFTLVVLILVMITEISVILFLYFIKIKNNIQIYFWFVFDFFLF
tara:strand:- start:798 stop:1028 length:231 start_codon:yes stop_codon:yes gene_type:complete